MPQDVNCPKCKHVFPVAEARQAFGVQCPSCDGEFTAEFRKLPAPAPGEPPYELLVSNGKPAGMALLEAKKKARDDDEEKVRKGGSMGMVIVVAVSALLITLGGLGFTGYYLFTHTDTTEYVSSGGNRPNTGGNRPNTGGGGGTKVNPGGGGGTPGIPQQPPKQETVFTDFSAPRYKFTAKFPGNPKEQTQPGSNGNTLTTFRVEGAKGGMLVSVEDLTVATKLSATDAEALLDKAVDLLVRNYSGTIQASNKSSSGTTANKVYIREFSAAIGKPTGVMRAKLYLTGNRVYQVMVIGAAEYVDSKDATTFINSFKITR